MSTTGDIWSGVGSDDVVTGEAVALDLPPASVGVRALSGVLDLAVELVTLVVVLTVVGLASAGSDQAVFAALMVAAFVLVLVVAPATLETLTRGRSLGKLALGLRTVRDDAGPITFRNAFLRALVGVIEVLMLDGIPALICALVTEKGKRLGDLVAGTYVLRDRVALVLTPPVPMPPALQSWAHHADVAGLPDGLALAVRQFLRRAHTLNPDARGRVGAQLSRQVSRFAAPPPPSGTHPEAFLAAVLAERRDRDAARLWRDEQLRRRFGAA